MCGIAGIVESNAPNLDSAIHAMLDQLQHRGPDNTGSHIIQENEFQLALGHTRLSILDLSDSAHQPMMGASRRFEIVFNGEVYNFREIRQELESIGVSFRTSSDTEVVLEAWEKWGSECISRFNGMFAFALYDRNEGKLFMVRDRAGVKPFYYYSHEGRFLFGSELKALMAHPSYERKIDHASAGLFIQYGYYPEPHTVFENTYKLRAGHYLELDLKTLSFSEREYWSLPTEVGASSRSQNEILEELEELMKSAFQYRMVSDVPVGVFLSGGYDSSLVSAMLQHTSNQSIQTFTIGFDDAQFNEASYANEVAEKLGTKHTEEFCTLKDAQQIIPELPSIYDEPFGDSSAIPTTLVSRVAKKKVKVALSADGGDELFGGYGKYKTSIAYANQLKGLSMLPASGHLMELVSPLIPFGNLGFNAKRRYQRVAQLLKQKLSPADAMNLSSQSITDKEMLNLIAANVKKPLSNYDKLTYSGDLSNEMLRLDFKTYLVDDILTKVDRASMSVSLESREPLLDYRLVEFVSKIPFDQKLVNANPKHLLKSICHKYLPKELMDRPKMGFGVPVIKWMRTDLQELLQDVLSQEVVQEAGVFQWSEVKKLKDSYLNGSDADFKVVWFLFVFHQWYLKWMK